jgi:23S rRNA (uracil1939-C5)-methyltransferase
MILSSTLRDVLKGLRGRLPEASWKPTEPHHWIFIDVDEDCHLESIVINRRRPFQQANKLQNVRMRTWIEERARLAPGPLLELFAGSGNFTEVLVTTHHQSITAIEVAASAVQKLTERAWPQVQAKRLDLYKPTAVREIQQLYPDTATLVVNPPRDGLRQLARLPAGLPKLQDMLYISCDPGTLAQDLRRLVDQGFYLVTVQALDQMPHTPHVEVLVHLSRA